MRSRVPILSALLILLGVLNSSVVAAKDARWGASYLPNVPVVTQGGKSVRFYDDVLKGKTAVISFIYTSCRDICPLVTARLTQLEDRLGELVGRSIVFVSISIDPATDTPAELKKFADAFGIKENGWVFLTGAPASIDQIRHRLGERGKAKTDHRNEILLYNDLTSEWERSSVMGDINALAMTVRAMDPAWREQVGSAEAALQKPQLSRAEPVRSDDEVGRPGQGLFTKLCAGCHTVGQGDKVGPDLRGVVSRRDRAWLTRYISEADTMRDDPIARELAKKFPTVRMPNLDLSPQDADDVLGFLQAQSYVAAAETRDDHRGHHHGQHQGHGHRHHH